MIDINAFRINGCSVSIDEAQPYLDQAHGVLCCIAHAIRDDTGGPNDAIVASAVDGATTLVIMAALGWQNWSNKPRPSR